MEPLTIALVTIVVTATSAFVAAPIIHAVVTRCCVNKKESE